SKAADTILIQNSASLETASTNRAATGAYAWLTRTSPATNTYTLIPWTSELSHDWASRTGSAVSAYCPRAKYPASADAAATPGSTHGASNSNQPMNPRLRADA